MKRSLLIIILAFLFGAGFLAMPGVVDAVPLNLNDFYLEGDGSIAADGASATLEVQDPSYGYTLLQNDPYGTYGLDPGIPVGANALSLSFGFEFVEPGNNDTELYVRLLDGNTGDLIDDFWVNETTTGTHTFDLTSLLTGQTLLGMDFAITEYNGGSGGFNLGSWATISDLDLAVQEATPVPEPGSLMLLGTSLIALGSVGKRRRH